LVDIKDPFSKKKAQKLGIKGLKTGVRGSKQGVFKSTSKKGSDKAFCREEGLRGVPKGVKTGKKG